jgi:hypothetical protein
MRETFEFVIVGEGEQRLLALLNSLNKGERLDSIHPLSRYNEIIEVLRDPEKPHSAFV